MAWQKKKIILFFQQKKNYNVLIDFLSYVVMCKFCILILNNDLQFGLLQIMEGWSFLIFLEQTNCVIIYFLNV
jgi:hypothetical protein